MERGTPSGDAGLGSEVSIRALGKRKEISKKRLTSRGFQERIVGEESKDDLGVKNT